MRHKWADIMHRYAEDATLKIQCIGGDGEWKDLMNPSFLDDYEYRIKPTPKPDVVRYLAFDPVRSETMRYNRPEHATEFERKCGLIRVSIDGETGALKSAEVLK